MIRIHHIRTGDVVGTLTEAQFATLVEGLEEESSADRDYYVNEDTLAMLADDGADPAVIDALRAALDGAAEGEVRWSRG